MARFAKTILPNGVRVVTEQVPAIRSVAVGVWVEVGSRHELPAQNGISHFIEHMHFKRTRQRTALHIAQALESLGGSLNAFTTREHTCYYARVLNQHLPAAMELIGDILNHSLYTPADLRKEKSVVAEEIKDVADTPAEYVHDLFDSRMWKGGPLGQPIMGTAKNIRALTRSEVLAFLRDHYYQGPNIVVAATGDVSHKAVTEMARRYFRWGDTRPNRQFMPPVANGFSLKAYPRKTKQSQVCLGFPSIGFGDADRYPLLAANTYLSGGMSSRLFQTVREKNGYCYSIVSFQEFFRDTGVFCVHYGADAKYVVKATALILKELRRLKERRLSATELHEVKQQLKGNLVLSLESMYNRMDRIARLEMMLGRQISLDEGLKLIDRITAAQIRATVNRIFDIDRLTMCTLGPTRQADLEKIPWSTLK
ncbi:MAG: insulinase family protein [candidate division Zixibacteria bacterium]|nr:insulinase family protein [candidate division Zixibacteria bacterium]